MKDVLITEHMPTGGAGVVNQLPVSVSVIIPVYNEEEYLGACLTSVCSSRYPAGCLEIVVVDNGSTDASLSIAQSFDVTLLVKEKARVGGVRNFGARHARGDVLVFVDADCVVDPTWLERGVHRLCEQDRVVLGGQYTLRANPSWIERYWTLSSSPETVTQRFLVGGCILIRRTSFTSIGGFDESLSAGEDIDLSIRLRAAGFQVTIDPSLSIVHLGLPRTIGEFLNRQTWHASNYAWDLSTAVHDRVFWVVIAFLFGCMGTLIGGLVGFGTGFALCVTLSAPAVLSAKRIRRAGRAAVRLVNLPVVFALDVLYVVGRLRGLLEGLARRLLGRERRRVVRR